MKKLRKYLVATLALIMVALICSCGRRQPIDVSGLLKTVPGDAAAVAVFDMQSILDDYGCKVKDSSVTPSDDIAKALANTQAGDSLLMMRLFADDCGVDPTVALIFAEGHDVYLTGYLAQPDKFKTAVAKLTGEQFAKSGDVETCSNFAVQGSRFWVRTSHRNDINASEIQRFGALSEQLSFMANDQAEALTKPEHDVTGWGNINGLLNVSALDFETRSMIGMTLGLFYDDPRDLLFDADMDKNEFEAEVSIINSKGKKAKFLYPTRKIDTEALAGISSTGSRLSAIAMDPAMIKKLKKGLGGAISMFKVYVDLLSPVDGTIGLVYGEEQEAESENKGSSASKSGGMLGLDSDQPLKGMIQTSGAETIQLQNALGMMGLTVNKDGKVLSLSRGKVTGPLAIADAAAELKGAMGGVVITGDDSMAQILPFDSEAIDNAALLLKPDDGSLQLHIKVKARPGSALLLND